jgi:hypothetical protein
MRILSVGSLLLFSTLWAYHLLAGGRLWSLPGIALGILLLLGGCASLLNLGDRYRIDDEGISYANPALGRLGVRLDRRVRWEEIVGVRTHRAFAHGVRESAPSALFLDVASGPRFVIDSVEGFDEMHRLVQTYAGGRPRAGAPPVAEEAGLTTGTSGSPKQRLPP